MVGPWFPALLLARVALTTVSADVNGNLVSGQRAYRAGNRMAVPPVMGQWSLMMLDKENNLFRPGSPLQKLVSNLNGSKKKHSSKEDKNQANLLLKLLNETKNKHGIYGNSKNDASYGPLDANRKLVAPASPVYRTKKEETSEEKIPLGLGVLSDVQKFFNELRSNIGTLEKPKSSIIATRYAGVAALRDPYSRSFLLGDGRGGPHHGDLSFVGGLPMYQGGGSSSHGRRHMSLVSDGEESWPQETGNLQPYLHSGLGR